MAAVFSSNLSTWTENTEGTMMSELLFTIYFQLQRMLHTLMSLYLNRSARAQG